MEYHLPTNTNIYLLDYPSSGEAIFRHLGKATRMAEK